MKKINKIISRKSDFIFIFSKENIKRKLLIDTQFIIKIKKNLY